MRVGMSVEICCFDEVDLVRRVRIAWYLLEIHGTGAQVVTGFDLQWSLYLAGCWVLEFAAS
jgi:hypothetical protein